ncbi:MAG: Biopolymer transport protein ExbD [Candidatus Accumulibacter adjunctus]|uniref:Biopolymer transport protein ExbD n=1 Tax=Candidatus Accumulibacter adjunctus TaxID=1454001 RepID=A0A011M813_9PROT|nr:MAG: Biopolymer transport protein ExbD [Candidatus Accumulibacter adjunctus]
MSDCRFRRHRPAATRADINVVPLVDVMLVLLVIFIVTAPLLTHAVKIDLPHASSQVNVTRAERVDLAVREDGALYWNGEPLTPEQFAERCHLAGRQARQPELHLHADRHVHYERVARVLAIAVRAGLQRVAFVSLPEERTAE